MTLHTAGPIFCEILRGPPFSPVPAGESRKHFHAAWGACFQARQFHCRPSSFAGRRDFASVCPGLPAMKSYFLMLKGGPKRGDFYTR